MTDQLGNKSDEMSSSHQLSDFAGSVSEAFVEVLERATYPTETQKWLGQQADQVNQELVWVLAQQALRYQQEQKWDEAAHLAAITLQAAEQWGDLELIAAAWTIRGDVVWAAGELKAALGAYEEAARRYVALEDSEEAAGCWGNCGLIASNLGQFSLAQDYLSQALTAFRLSGNDEQIARALIGLGTVVDDCGKPAEAESYYREALALSRAVGDAESEAGVLNNLGQLFDKQGQWSKAITLFTQALSIQQQIGN